MSFFIVSIFSIKLFSRINSGSGVGLWLVYLAISFEKDFFRLLWRILSTFLEFWETRQLLKITKQLKKNWSGINVWKYSCCIVHILEEFNSFYRCVLANGDCEGFASYQALPRINMERLDPLALTSFECKIIRSDTIIEHTAMYIIVKSHDQLNEIRPKFKGF